MSFVFRLERISRTFSGYPSGVATKHRPPRGPIAGSGVRLVGYVRDMNVGAKPPPLVVFGVTGDLARKKVFPALYELARAGRPFGNVVGVGRSDWATADLRRAAALSVSLM